MVDLILCLMNGLMVRWQEYNNNNIYYKGTVQKQLIQNAEMISF